MFFSTLNTLSASCCISVNFWFTFKREETKKCPSTLREKGKKRMKDFFTVNGLAEYFNVNPKTIYRRLWAKQIPAYKVGKTWRIAKKEIEWLRR